MIKIRNEKESDYKVVEDITRKAFYNLYVPGCGEHYLVHVMRGHEDFIPELDFVLELGPVMAISEEEARQYDDSLEKMEKKYLPSQEEFYIMSHSFMK